MLNLKNTIDWRNVLLILAVLGAVGIVAFWIPYLRSRNLSGPKGVLGKASVTILYTKNGFEPKTVTVKVGTTVAWKDPSSRPMWVASDPHPTHTDLPGFDQKEIIDWALPSVVGTAFAHGDAIYEYTFTKVGTWRYHNHIYPADTGTVIVIPD